MLENTIIAKQGLYEFNPDVMFSLLKNNVATVDVIEAERKSNVLASQYKQARDLGQEKLQKEIGIERLQTDHLLKITAQGYTKYLSLKSIDSFREKTPACYLDNLKDFRIIYKVDEEKDFEVGSEKYNQAMQRKEALEKIQQALKSGLFDDILILNLNYPRFEEEEKKRKEEEEKRVKEAQAKDPIAFGISKIHPEHAFFIADWMDEFCDLTLDKLIKSL